MKYFRMTVKCRRNIYWSHSAKLRKPGQFDSVSRNCSCAGVFKSLKPIFAENKHEIIKKNEISPLFVGKNFLFCRICCSVGWCNERPQNQIRNLITKEERILFWTKFPKKRQQLSNCCHFSILRKWFSLPKLSKTQNCPMLFTYILFW